MIFSLPKKVLNKIIDEELKMVNEFNKLIFDDSLSKGGGD